MVVKPGYAIVSAPQSSAVGVSCPGRKMPNISSLPILQEISNDMDEDEDEEKEGSEGSKEVKVDGSSSSSSGSGFGDSKDDEVEEDDGHKDLEKPQPIESVKLGLQGDSAKE